MSRLSLICWKETEVHPAIARLRRAGYHVERFVPSGGSALRDLERSAPDLFVIDLDRAPSQGRDIGVWLRRRKATREIPIVFAGGEAEKVERVRRLLPDATFTPWSRVRGALKRALRPPAAKPVVPNQMDGYSGTPLVKKLGIRADSAVHLLGAPAGFERKLRPLPDGVRVRRQARGKARRVLLFAKSRAELARRFPSAARSLADGGGLWLLWPKKAAGLRTDLDQAFVRAFGMEREFVDYKIAAIDATWSGLLFARRRA